MTIESQSKYGPEVIRPKIDYPQTAFKLSLSEGNVVAVVRVIRGDIKIYQGPNNSYTTGNYWEVTPQDAKNDDYIVAQVGRVISVKHGETIVEPFKDNEGRLSEYDVSQLKSGNGPYSLMPKGRWPNELTHFEPFAIAEESPQFIALSEMEDNTFVGRMYVGKKRLLHPPKTITIATMPHGYDTELSTGNLRLLIPGINLNRRIVMRSTQSK